ncbi:PREDICTED: uncharacterized protein LOC108576525 [Habropoda laboriosa]|uniref:uncharacterized protein LOC108576525 n=1 Tax=Habropoda laboriosa TaxID=597456 RepID=UPI00083D1998|nr:PREDICTED: uncharacterized protein LOC108576525 [Habropoda laboriosa]
MANIRKEWTMEKRTEIITPSKPRLLSKTGISKSFVQNTVARFRYTGSVVPKKRCERPKKTTPVEDLSIEIISKRNRRMSAREIAAEINSVGEDLIGLTTVKMRLLQVGLRRCVAVQKPLLKPLNKAKRLQWARVHADWTISD